MNKISYLSMRKIMKHSKELAARRLSVMLILLSVIIASGYLCPAKDNSVGVEVNASLTNKGQATENSDGS